VYSGVSVGIVLGFSGSGILAASNWRNCFYVFGIIGGIWFVVWALLVSETPNQCKRTSQEERDYINTSIWKNMNDKDRHVAVPWRNILKSAPFWALLMAHMGCTWGLYTLMTQIPTYMNHVLHFNIKENGLLSSLPYISMFVASLIASYVADTLMGKGILSTTAVRKLMNSISYYIPGLILIWVAFTGCDRVLTVVLLTAAVGLNGAFFSAYIVNHVDLSPSFAGPMMGFTNFWANICGIVTPYVAGVIVTDPGNLFQWRIVFFIAAGVYLFTNTVFVTFGSGKEQWWNNPNASQSKTQMPPNNSNVPNPNLNRKNDNLAMS